MLYCSISFNPSPELPPHKSIACIIPLKQIPPTDFISREVIRETEWFCISHGGTQLAFVEEPNAAIAPLKLFMSPALSHASSIHSVSVKFPLRHDTSKIKGFLLPLLS